MHLSEASNTFLAVRQQEGFSSHTIAAYRLQYGLLIRDIGDLALDQITLQVLRVHLSHQAHLKAASMGHKVRSIKSLFFWLYEEGMLERNPALKLLNPR